MGDAVSSHVQGAWDRAEQASPGHTVPAIHTEAICQQLCSLYWSKNEESSLDHFKYNK